MLLDVDQRLSKKKIKVTSLLQLVRCTMSCCYFLRTPTVEKSDQGLAIQTNLAEQS